MTGNESLKIGGLLLAAGGSSRLGRPKQLLQFHGKTLLRRAAETLADSVCDPIIIVLGAEIDGSKSEIADLRLHVVVNDDWQAGMSSSIKAGLKGLLNIEPNLAAVVITLCDQPYVIANQIGLFTTEFHNTRADIIAAKYGETTGVPALFSHEMFDKLLCLEGDKGARELIRNTNSLVTIKLGEGAFDIDTLRDLDVKAPC